MEPKKKNGNSNPKVYSYLRVSTLKQDLENQRLEIASYCKQNGLEINDTIEVELSSRRSKKERRIDDLLNQLRPGDTLIVSELSRLGRSLIEILDIVNFLIKKNVRFIAIKQGMIINGRNDIQTKVMITMFGLLAEIERDLISERTKMGLARARAEGKKLGNPRFDLDNKRNKEEAQAFAESLRPVLEGLRSQGMSQRKMIEELNKLGVKARRGGQWSLIQLQNVLKRL